MNVATGCNQNQFTPQTRTICRFHLRGMCRFGNRCRNLHEEITSETPNSLQKSSTDQSIPSGSGATSHFLNSFKAMSVSEGFGPGANSSLDAVNLVRIAQSKEKSCGICFDVVIEKVEKQDQVFGILPNCNHCFCFSCIRKWRQSKEFELDVAKACPECRVASDYVYPSRYWMDEKEEKESFLSQENNRMQKIDCRYFRKGHGKCPFGNTCVFLHALPNGKKCDVGPPKPRRRRTSAIEHEMVHDILFWLNEDDLEGDNDIDSDFDLLDLDDPTIAYQYYDRDDIRRYIALNQLMNPDDSDDSEYEIF